MTKTVLVVAAHPDDEVLGCGGTVAKHVASGDRVHVVFMANGVGARGGKINDAVRERETATFAAAKILGTISTTCLGFPDNRMDSLALIDIVQPFEKALDKIKPEIIYTHHYGDLNVDHRITHQAVMTACRAMPGSSVNEILTFEVMSSTEWNSPNHAQFQPNLFVDTSAFLELKIKALKAYSIEMRLAPHSRSIENLVHLARHRGCCIGVQAAEAFMVMRIIR